MTSKQPIYIMTDEEFFEMKKSENKESVLSNLLDASKNNTKFSMKTMKKKKEPDKSSEMKSSMNGSDILFEAIDIPEKVEGIVIDDEKWDDMMAYFDEISPIDDIVNDERYSYRRNSDEDDYQRLFKKENSMLSDVLSDLQKRSKLINNKINAMSGKGTYGISKNFTELVEAANSLDSTKLSVIKEMVGIKKTAADLKLKDKRLNPDEGIDDRDSVADAFYKQIIGGGTKNFLQSTLTPYAGLQGGIVGTGSVNNQEYNDDIGFNITQPIPYANTDSGYDEIVADKYGYIANENRNVEICIYRYEDGSMKFVALDEDGEVVHNYELPSEVLLDDIRTKPMSSYAYDKYDRKYKIIDISTSGVDLSDMDDDNYDDISDDDKYDY